VAVRPARAGDGPQLLRLIRRYWEFEGIAGFDAQRIGPVLATLIDSDGSRGAVWVADEADTLCGYLVVVLVMSLEHQGLMGEIDELFVLPEARARGLGAQLLTAAETWLSGRGCRRLQLQLNPSNRTARAFYARRGFAARSGYELLDRPLP
jgi:GNAT superfamily N-acetyltransferase